MGNLLGEPFKKYVNDQIRIRQKIHGKKNNRTTQEIQYLSSKNAWVKLASAVMVNEDRIKLLGSNPLVKDIPRGSSLAMANVLFNGLTKVGNEYEKISSKKDTKGPTEPPPSPTRYNFLQQQRSGIIGNNRAYGVGGTYEYGYSPMPGIIDVDINDLNRGSIKKAIINIKAHNRNQFDIIDVLYLRLGYTVLLEWGNDKYLKDIDANGEGVLENMGPTLIDNEFFKKGRRVSYKDFLPLIEKEREKYGGNYDGLLGVISNFSWTFEPDGSYNIKLEIISQGDIIESLKVNLPPNSTPNVTKVDTRLSIQLQQIAQFGAQNSTEFYDILYPGLEDIIENWWNGYINDQHPLNTGFGIRYEGRTGEYDSEFSFLPKITAFGFDFPNFNAGSYTNENEENQNTIQSGAGIQLVETAVFRSLRDLLDEKALKMHERGGDFINEDGTQKKKFTLLDYTGKRLLQPKGTISPTKEITKVTSNFNQFTEEVVADGKNKAAEANEEFDTDAIIRKIIINNLSLTDFKEKFFQFFVRANRAGGEEDPQFKPPELTEEEQEAIANVERLENEKAKNKVSKYLVDVEEIWTTGDSKKGDNFTFGNGVSLRTPNPVRVGSIINPFGGASGLLNWYSKVKFPRYQTSNTSIDFVKLNINQLEKSYFIRLGTLLEFIEKKVIPNVNIKNKLISLDTNPKANVCYVIDNMISLDPNILIIRNGKFFNGASYEKIFPELNQFIAGKNGFLYGKLMNVYLNFSRVKSYFDATNEKNEVFLYNVLENIARDINECLGGVNNIQVTVNKETNTARFIDQTPIPGINSLANEIEGYENYNKKSETLEVFGYNNSNNTSNFVRNVGITTEISKDYSTIITIGATARGAIPGAESTAFSEWNKGLQDRFKREIDDAESGGKDLEDQNETVKQNYGNMISEKFSKLGFNNPVGGKFDINSELVNLNKSVASSFYIYAQAITREINSKSTESSIGFIPFNLKVEMDGLSGIKIYNKINVNTSFLPTNYGNTLDFIITGVNHKLSGNEWVTNLDTIATTKDRLAN